MASNLLFFISSILLASVLIEKCASNPVNPPKVPTIDLITPKGPVPMPILGYGTWQAKDAELEAAVNSALEAGYRHIDTAYVYENEKVIGKVLKEWFTAGKLNRSDIFLTSKLPPKGMRPDGVPKYLQKSLNNLQVDYLDLYLVHNPVGFVDIEDKVHPINADGTVELDLTTDHIAIWKAFEEQVDKGLVRAIGISNFNKSQISRVLKNARIPPSSLQIELHAYNQQNELVDFSKENNITVTAYSPIGSPGLTAYFNRFGYKVDLPIILKNPTIVEIARKHNKSPAQILLRHIIQRGIAAIPKSTNPERMRQNINIFDFSLDEKDVEAINGLNQNYRLLDFRTFKGVERHPEYPFGYLLTGKS